jgi:hypothetical protein
MTLKMFLGLDNMSQLRTFVQTENKIQINYLKKIYIKST